ncbi:MAG: hypothetical protein A3J29_02150 [Acidobacteria bacterium RIFCSPLOWO2_12_FULL_67_14b]|nr:MAG: hypothetical protein A3J29_02150 [Acidobacteria bacterium RIFCSPLOWO2_12_FULL_67_14b]
MLKSGIVALDLRGKACRDKELDWLHGVVDQTFELLRDLLASSGESERVEVSSRLDQCRAALAADDDAGVARALSAQLLLRCREVVAHARQQEIDRRAEMASLVALVREAVMSVGTEMDTFQDRVDQSTERFEAISALDDPRQIQARLVAEVTVLKQVASERRRAWESTSRSFSERVETLEQQLSDTRSEAALDALTGIANRRTFDRTCQAWIRSARSRFVLAILDVDEFKGVNDTYGHALGDRVLVGIAQALVGSVREGDVVARLGGDEFAILASDLTLRQAEGRFGKTVALLGAEPGGWASSLPVKPRMSCGIAEFSAGDSYASLFERADEALYVAKRQGKNRVATKARAFIRDLMKR